jgi:hypothetical protein
MYVKEEATLAIDKQRWILVETCDWHHQAEATYLSCNWHPADQERASAEGREDGDWRRMCAHRPISRDGIPDPLLALNQPKS